jgi:preprotein translocase subunit SecA
MFGAIAKALFGSQNDRVLKRFNKPVEAINALEPEIQALSDEELRGKTAIFKQRYAAGETLDDLLV